MDQYRVIMMPSAGKDIQELHEHISRRSPQNAAAMVAKILGAIEDLKVTPNRTVADFADRRLRYPVRRLTVRPYNIYFRVLDDVRAVRILHVIHGARQPPGRFD